MFRALLRWLFDDAYLKTVEGKRWVCRKENTNGNQQVQPKHFTKLLFQNEAKAVSEPSDNSYVTVNMNGCDAWACTNSRVVTAGTVVTTDCFSLKTNEAYLKTVYGKRWIDRKGTQ